MSDDIKKSMNTILVIDDEAGLRRSLCAYLEDLNYDTLTTNLCAPIAYEGNENGEVSKMICIRMELGEPDEGGRRRPEPVPNSQFEIEVDTVISFPRYSRVHQKYRIIRFYQITVARAAAGKRAYRQCHIALSS